MKAFSFAILLTLAAALTSTAALAPTETETGTPDEAASENWLLQEPVRRLVADYKATEPVKLPELPKEKYEGWDDRYSYPPGVMPYVRQVTVDKPHCRLMLKTVHGDLLWTRGVCASANRGQKKRKDDSRTPEGRFNIIGVYNSTDWTYKDTGVKAYGPFFIHLHTPPFYGIGIHGTNVPWSVPGRRSHGCMRMHNEDITQLRRMINKDTRVTVVADADSTIVFTEP